MTWLAVLLTLLGWQQQGTVTLAPTDAQITAYKGISSGWQWNFMSTDGKRWIKVSSKGEVESSEPMTAPQVAVFMVEVLDKLFAQDREYHAELIKEQDRLRGIATSVIEQYQAYIKQSQQSWREIMKDLEDIRKIFNPPKKPVDKKRI